MKIKKCAQRMSRGVSSITEVAAWIGYIMATAIVLIVFVDVCGRYFFNKPLAGSYELVVQAMGALAGFAIMYATVKRGHVALDLVVNRFSRRTQIIMQSIFSFLGFGTWAVITYELYVDGVMRALKISELTPGILGMSTAPALFMLAIATFLCSLTLLRQAFRPAESKEISGDEERIRE